jgi:hypothetical protein
MKNALIICTAIIFSSCGLLNGGGIIIDTPTVPSVNICENVASDADVSKMITKGYCFKAAQVVLIMDSMVFADDELEMAKHLYKPTTDKENYYLCIDALAHKSDRDELKAYIAAN